MIGIIGGTGLYQLDGLKTQGTQEIETPYGSPSAPVSIGHLGSRKIAFLPRHGANHELLPFEINFRANIWALKAVGVRRVFSVSAVGSLRHEIEPGSLVIPSQYFDSTKGKRAGTFFGDGLVAHVSTAEPTCPSLSKKALAASQALGTKTHQGKTYACVEGPRLGTRAESFFLKGAQCDIVGMTNVPEAYLAREAQLCYCTIGVVTDYDCWLDDPSQHASVEKVIALYMQNLKKVQAILQGVISSDDTDCDACRCGRALHGAVLTNEASLSPEKKRILDFLRS